MRPNEWVDGVERQVRQYDPKEKQRAEHSD